jgi:hypothetical protein
LAASDWACGFGARMRVRIEKLRRRVAKGSRLAFG